MLVVENATKTTNFFVIGQARSGTGVVQGALASTNGVSCHANLLHADVGIRRECHENYFGLSLNPDRFPGWFAPLETARCAPQYLLDSVFDHPRLGERAVGVRLLYSQLRDLDLFDMLADRRFGLRVVHVRRNPVACFISLKQAERSGQWRQYGTSDATRPLPVRIEPDELIQFMRDHEATAGKINQLRRLAVFTLDYAQLANRYIAAMEALWVFLGLVGGRVAAPPLCRIRHRGDFPRRVANWGELKSLSALRGYLEDIV